MQVTKVDIVLLVILTLLFYKFYYANAKKLDKLDNTIPGATTTTVVPTIQEMQSASTGTAGTAGTAGTTGSTSLAVPTVTKTVEPSIVLPDASSTVPMLDTSSASNVLSTASYVDATPAFGIMSRLQSTGKGKFNDMLRGVYPVTPLATPLLFSNSVYETPYGQGYGLK